METPLHIAARVKDGDRCALMLLKSGAGANQTTEDGQTPVHVAALHGNLTTLLLLLEDGGDPLFTSKVLRNKVRRCFFYVLLILLPLPTNYNFLSSFEPFLSFLIFISFFSLSLSLSLPFLFFTISFSHSQVLSSS